MTESILKRGRRVALTQTEIEILVGLTGGFDGAIITGLHEKFIKLTKEGRDPEHWRIRDAYVGAIEPDDDLSVNDDAEVALGDDPGAYVMVWQWVSAGEAGVCSECNGSLDDGKGYDGLCGDCADKHDEITCMSCGDKTSSSESPDNARCPDCYDRETIEV